MGMSVGGGDDEDTVLSDINTTPLVDVMLVLLIIFLITIPVATHSVKVDLPKDVNQPSKIMPDNITLAVTPDGQAWWDQSPIRDHADLMARLEKVAAKKPQPQIMIRGDANARYEAVGKLVAACQEAGVMRVDFIIEAPHN
ncbi:tonB-dependent biopolymer transporter integral cytoplasmic membrane subunit ExbD/TolR [Acetobacter aceti NRIC 0242]|uniref:Biopolymer transporter ExbD n=1 Tax=Acetobacter aceti NBRC 14818 TaxID=887700 RepID=A0AB33II32_ACEAC|nr:biopolymer transporter ExbD [Acetobacter aceti]TCS33434.1 biopolymer transport protein ExbD [Acetobacter aceti NBRC 14818]BCK77601.1 biopolymer transporter ExbD [Acetobacter aceti NBRC 14818]GAN56760.1 TonB-dependent biopolymer transport protein ExbD/TolR [Acetobacter aceti NBRC 14818]GBO80374.1 tonB-dependent biopolymer transporter integral cytoplasmic membrane subunit ExbD/TolR [Acetobacter aceti NRIC 0242]